MKKKKLKLSKKQIVIIVVGLIIAIIFSPIASFSLSPFGLGCTFIGILIVISGIFEPKITIKLKNEWHKKSGKVWITLVSVFLAIALVYGAVASVLIMSKAKSLTKTEIPKNTTAILLGCSVRGDTPSPMLQKRINAAYGYLTENPDAMCILSGGKGENENLSEAAAMYNSLTEKGIDGNRLIMEDKSTSTIENFEFSKKIIDENGLGDEVVIITTDFHQYRASLIAKDNDLTSYAVSSKSGTFSLPTFLVREWFTLAAYLLG